jgi:hypothetical protein
VHLDISVSKETPGDLLDQVHTVVLLLGDGT